MSKVFGIIMLVVSLIGYAFGETEFYGDNWFRYTLKMEDDKTKESQFGIRRIYLRWTHKHTDKFESRVTVEHFSDERYTHSAGTKLKDGYMKIKGIIPMGDIKIGLQKVYFGRIYDWEYFPIEKTPETRYKLIDGSRDYGISIGGYFPHGYGTWRLEAVHGEGYKKIGKKVNTELAYIVDMRLIPVAGLTLGSSYLRENVGPKRDTLRQCYTGFVRFNKGPIDICILGLGGQKKKGDKIKTQMGYMIFPKLHFGELIGKNFEFLIRYDYWDPDVDKEDNAKFLYLCGFNYYFTKDIVLQVVALRDQPEKKDSKPTDGIKIQLSWKWKQKIKA